MSLPARGAWIEIPHTIAKKNGKESRSPQGERGLKYTHGVDKKAVRQSLPARGAWIEIRQKDKKKSIG